MHIKTTREVHSSKSRIHFGSGCLVVIQRFRDNHYTVNKKGCYLLSLLLKAHVFQHKPLFLMPHIFPMKQYDKDTSQKHKIQCEIQVMVAVSY